MIISLFFGYDKILNLVHVVLSSLLAIFLVVIVPFPVTVAGAARHIADWPGSLLLRVGTRARGRLCIEETTSNFSSDTQKQWIMLTLTNSTNHWPTQSKMLSAIKRWIQFLRCYFLIYNKTSNNYNNYIYIVPTSFSSRSYNI